MQLVGTAADPSASLSIDQSLPAMAQLLTQLPASSLKIGKFIGIDQPSNDWRIQIQLFRRSLDPAYRNAKTAKNVIREKFSLFQIYAEKTRQIENEYKRAARLRAARVQYF